MKKTVVLSNGRVHGFSVFEFDPAKSDSNQRKHGIDFVAAQSLWVDPCRIELQARSDGEVRNAIVAQFREKIWFAVYTEREKRIRLISVRRARKIEEKYYYEKS